MHSLKMLLWRRKEISVERYVVALKDMESKARECYAGTISIAGDEFVEMTLLDGCFVVELIRMCGIAQLREESDDPLADFVMRRAIMRDLLLVENQLPFFVLLRLFDLIAMPNEAGGGFKHMAINFFSILMPGHGVLDHAEDTNHLLGLLYRSLFSSPKERPTSLADTVSITAAPRAHYLSRLPCLHARKSLAKATRSAKSALGSLGPDPVEHDVEANVGASGDDKGASIVHKSIDGHEWGFIRSATELNEAGIEFKRIKSKRFFDIEFENGVMRIPLLKIDDDTMSFLRNLVVYEQRCKGSSPKPVTDYITFMDCLINTGEDVKLLSRNGIIDNWLGDDKVVATMFNRIRNSVLISKENFFYSQIFIDVNKHRNRKWNQWKATLRHNYFNTPWALISFLGAVFLLLLTVIQTVFSVLSYHHQ